MSEKVFVSGIAGFLGSHLAEALLREGHTVIGCDNLIGGEVENVPAGAEFIELDCNDLDRLKPLVKGCAVVYHCAATAHEGLSVFSPHENVVHGIGATSGMLSAAISNNVRRFVFLSSMARYGTQPQVPFREEMVPRPQDPYAVQKVASEHLVRLMAMVHGFEFSIGIPHNIIGPRQRHTDPFRNVASIFINMMLQGRQPFIYGDGSQARCFSFVADVVDPLIKLGFAEEAKNEIFNLGPDDEFVTVLSLARKIARKLNFDLQPVFTPGRPQEVHRANCSADKARAALGYSPKVTLDEGLDEMIEWIRQKGPRPFEYHMKVEIESDRTPKTWKDRLF